MPSDYLTNAFTDAERMYGHSCKAVTNTAGSMLAPPTGVGFQHSNLGRAKEQLSHNTGYVYAAIRAVATRVSGQNFSIGKMLDRPSGKKLLDLPRYLKSLGDNLEPMPSHPFLEALNCPNPLMVRWSLLYSLTSSLMLTGKAYLWITESENKLQVWPIPSHWIEPSDPMRGSWKLRPFGSMEEIELPSQSVCCIMLPSPASPFEAVSPLQTMAHAVAIDSEIQNAQYRAFKNGIHPGVMIRMAKNDQGQRPILSSNQRQEIIQAILAMHGGTMKRNSPMIVDGTIESIEKLTSTPQEMDFAESAKQVKGRVLEAFGVSPAILGQLENSNRAAAWAAEANFVATTINPLIQLMSESLTKFVQNYYQQKLVCWITPASADDRELTQAAWRDARSSGFVSQNEYRRHILNLPDVDGGDTFRDELGNPIDDGKSFHLNGHARV